MLKNLISRFHRAGIMNFYQIANSESPEFAMDVGKMASKPYQAAGRVVRIPVTDRPRVTSEKEDYCIANFI